MAHSKSMPQTALMSAVGEHFASFQVKDFGEYWVKNYTRPVVQAAIPCKVSAVVKAVGHFSQFQQDANLNDGTCHNWGATDLRLHLTAARKWSSVTKSISSTMLVM